MKKGSRRGQERDGKGVRLEMRGTRGRGSDRSERLTNGVGTDAMRPVSIVVTAE
jgi:hypothetical protein